MLHAHIYKKEGQILVIKIIREKYFLVKTHFQQENMCVSNVSLQFSEV
jgi:hypothetical protein